MRSSRRSSPRRPAVVGLAPGLVLAMLSLAACSPALQGQSHPVPPTVTITDAWVRAPIGGGDMTAAYMVITGPSTEVRLVSASSPAATRVTLHRTTTDASGMTAMDAVAQIDIPAQGVVHLEPGGYHLMLEGLKTTLQAGQFVQLNLGFDNGVTSTVQAEVKAG